MRQSARWIVFGSLLAAACGEGTVPTQSDTSTTAAPSFAMQSSEGYLTHVHVMPPKAQNWEALAKTAAGTGSGTGIYYHGGPVMLTVNVAAIYWGSESPMYTNGPAAGSGAGTGSNDGSLIGAFLRGVGGSSYWKINTDYSDGTNSPVPLAVNYTKYWADNSSTSSATTDAGIQAEVVRAIGVLGYDATTIYSVFTGPNVNLGGGFKTQYCAYHGKFTWNGNVVIYSVQPYNDGVSVCSQQTTGPNAPLTGDATVNTLAHEIEEAATDPRLNAWFDRRGYENADKCAWTFGTTYAAGNGALANMKLPNSPTGRDFLIQRNWKNRGSGGCSTGI